MRLLRFDRPTRGADGRTLRKARFQSRSALPVGAACVVANGVREMLGSLLDAPVMLRLTEPLIPSAEAWRIVLADTLLYRIAGSVADAALVFGFADATVLVGAAFGEPQPRAADARPLSAIERDVLDRMVGEIAVNLGPVCGVSQRHVARRVESLENFETFFDLIVESPVQARIGVAISRDPIAEPRATLATNDLGGVGIDTMVVLPLQSASAAHVIRLRVGSIVPIRSADFSRCRLAAYGQPLASGTCGARNGRYAFAARSLSETIAVD
ncbi:MAG: hypothetical protein JO030_06695 [Candidatus Eremiobacteraeota bacterium]|nr:hypothetical protein [Candidatus Eremiobacteraeota bacterium]